MPILKHQPHLYPPELFETPPESARWWALYTRSRREKDLMRRLMTKKTAFFSPIVEKQHRSPNGRLRTAYVPLFANYVFIAGTEDDRYEAMCTGCVSSDLEVFDTTTLINDLRQIHELIQVGVPLSAEPEIPAGALVRVTSGVLEGREGVVIERRGHRRLLIRVNFLQQGASAELQDCDVEVI